MVRDVAKLPDQKIEALDQPDPDTHSGVEFDRHPQFELFEVGLGGDVLADRRAQCGDDGFGQALVCARILEPLHRRVRIKG